MEFAPILVLGYKRPHALRQCLDALENCELASSSKVYIVIDGAKGEQDRQSVDECAAIAKMPWNFKSVDLRVQIENLGLSHSMKSSVDRVFQNHNRIIVLEDDLICHRKFLRFMNQSLEKFEDQSSVASIQGFTFIEKQDGVAYFLRGADCWGWGTWKIIKWGDAKWDSLEHLEEIKQRKLRREFNFDNSYNFTRLLELNILRKINSWAIDWQASNFLLNRFSLYPPFNMIENLGSDRDATHMSKNKFIFPTLSNKKIWHYPKAVFMERTDYKSVSLAYLKMKKMPLWISLSIRWAKNRVENKVFD